MFICYFRSVLSLSCSSKVTFMLCTLCKSSVTRSMVWSSCYLRMSICFLYWCPTISFSESNFFSNALCKVSKFYSSIVWSFADASALLNSYPRLVASSEKRSWRAKPFCIYVVLIDELDKIWLYSQPSEPSMKVLSLFNNEGIVIRCYFSGNRYAFKISSVWLATEINILCPSRRADFAWSMFV